MVKAFFDLVKPKTSYSYAVLPGYIKGLTEQTPHMTSESQRNLFTLYRYILLFPSAKDRPSPDDQTNVVYKFKSNVQIAAGTQEKCRAL